MNTLQQQLAAKANTETLEQQVARLLAENEALKAATKTTVRNGLKISEKGAVSLYGMGRFPISLYAEQWEKVLAMQSEILAFIADGKRQGLITPKTAKAQ